jgi:hypothetical protein
MLFVAFGRADRSVRPTFAVRCGKSPLTMCDLIVIFIRFRESFWVACTWWELAVRNKPKVNAAGFDELNIFE